MRKGETEGANKKEKAKVKKVHSVYGRIKYDVFLVRL